MTSECPMHQEFSAVPGFTIVRCSHIGDRYVIEAAYPDGSLLDLAYVQADDEGVLWLEPWAAHIAEHGQCGVDGLLACVWDTFVERMRADVPPRPVYATERYMRRLGGQG